MWVQTQSTRLYNESGSVRYEKIHDEDAHAHSPRKAGRSRRSSQSNGAELASAQWSSRTTLAPGLSWNAAQANHDALVDPFVDTHFQHDRARQPIWSQKLSSEDISMPDYRSRSTSDSSKALTGMSGVSYEQKTVSEQVDDAQIAELVEALSPLRGTQAHSNAPFGDKTTAIIVSSRPSIAKEARASIYTSIRSKKEGINKENDSSLSSSGPSSRPPSAKFSSQASLPKYVSAKNGDELLAEGKRKRTPAGTPEGRIRADSRNTSPGFVSGTLVDDSDRHAPALQLIHDEHADAIPGCRASK